jgi:PLP dependent protein
MEAAPGKAAPGKAAPGEVAPGEVAPGEVAPGEVAPGEVAGRRTMTWTRPSLAEVVERLGLVRERIEAAATGRGRVKVVAVTKGFPAPVVGTAVDAGLTELGESYAQELVTKAAVAPASVRWHFLGALQRRRAGALASHVAIWEAMDRREAADVVAARQPGGSVLVQVNLVGDPAKHGCRVADAPGLVSHCRGVGLDVRGLMTVGPAGDPEGARRCFSELATMAGDLGLAELSMGMSDDYEIAVAEGATSVRLGRALFGPRPSGHRARR